MSDQLYRYTISMDDSGKLTVLGRSAELDTDNGYLQIHMGANEYWRISWQRIRWYKCERMVATPPVPSAESEVQDDNGDAYVAPR